MKRTALLVCFIVCFAFGVNAQKKAVPTSSLCTQDYAVDTTTQQILQTRTFDNQVHRIAVLIRAADLLWPHDQAKARATFMEAFDLAVQNFKENGDETQRTSKSQFAGVIQLPDQRFKVLSAFAKRDPVKARKLSEQMLQDDARDSTDKPAAANDWSKRRTADKILQLARSLIATDVPAAINFARQSFRYSANLSLPSFLYELARTNKQAADQLYLEALTAYGATPMDQFLYLSSYPFGSTREAGEMPSYTYYPVPEGYVPNLVLQRQFMQALLARSEAALTTPVEETPAYRYSDHDQMWLALSRLEKQVQDNLPDLAEATTRTKEKLFSALNQDAQKQLTGAIAGDNEPKKSFDDAIEFAEKQKDPGRRDQLLTFAIQSAGKDEPLEKILSIIDKISEQGIRGSLLNWFFYFRAQALIESKDLTGARALAGKVTEMDQRAYLFTRIAEESLKQTEDQSEARDVLNEISAAVDKAPKTIVSARALLALAHLYAKIDVNRGIEELGNAVKTINTLESPDFSQQSVMMKIEGKTFGSYAAFSTPGFNPENAFREMSKLDFDGSLAQATTFTDKSLRALTTLAVVEPCFSAKKAQKH